MVRINREEYDKVTSGQIEYAITYLADPRWKKIRDERLSIDMMQCAICGYGKNPMVVNREDIPLDVHHLLYPSEMFAEDPENDLVTLCESCHAKVHRYDSERQKWRERLNKTLYKSCLDDKAHDAFISAIFASWAWDKAKFNGGNANLLNESELSQLRKQFSEKFDIDATFNIHRFHTWLNDYMNLLVMKGCIEGKSIKAIAQQTGLSESTISKRKKVIMPKIDRNEYMSTEAKLGGGGGFEQMEPGVYELYIQAIRTEWDTRNGHTDGIAKQCVRIVWDVASGPFEKKFTDSYFVDWEGKPDVQRDFMHSCFLSWKKIPYLKSKLDALDAANPGFDSFAAFEADRWDMFIGKRFWAVVDGTVSLNDNGYDRWTLDVNAWITPEQARSGKHPEPVVTDNRMKQKSVAAPSTYGSTLNV